MREIQLSRHARTADLAYWSASKPVRTILPLSFFVLLYAAQVILKYMVVSYIDIKHEEKEKKTPEVLIRLCTSSSHNCYETNFGYQT